MLNGLTALVVEEQFLIALDIERMLEALGITHTLFARTAAEAELLISHGTDIAIAIIEIRRADVGGSQLITRLYDAKVPCILTTADSDIGMASKCWPTLAVLTKPLPEDNLVSAVAQALGAHA